MSILLAMFAQSFLAQTSSKQSTQALYAQGMDLMQKGRPAEAQRLLLKAHAQSPADLTIKVSLAKVDSVLGQNAEAVTLFREIASQDPTNGDDQRNLAIALASENSLEEALLPATQATQLLPRAAAAHQLRGKILDGLGRTDEAAAEFETALHLAPHNTSTLFDYSLLCESSGRLPREIELLTQLIALEPAKALLHALLGRALSRASDQAAARTQFREALQLDPQNRLALYSLSRSLAKDEPGEAAALTARFQAQRLSEDETNRLRDEGNQGVLAMQARDWPRAVALFEAALTTCAGCELEAAFEKDLGLAQCQGGDTMAGAASLRRSLALEPKDLDTVKALETAEAANASRKQ